MNSGDSLGVLGVLCECAVSSGGAALVGCAFSLGTVSVEMRGGGAAAADDAACDVLAAAAARLWVRELPRPYCVTL